MIADAAAREAKKIELFGVIPVAPKASTPATPDMTLATGATLSGATTQAATGTIAVPTNTGSITPTSKYANLDEKYYYSKEGKKLSLVIRSLSLTPEVSDTAKEVSGVLESAGIATTIEDIENSPDAINNTTKNGNKSYDILVTGVNLGFLGTYVFPYFHSGQSENGYNFSKLRNPSLDILLEDLKSRDMPKEARERNETRIIELLRKESVIAPISAEYTPYFIDKNIKEIHTVRILPSATFLFSILEPSYIKETHIIRIESKSV